jgi:poly-gamma-glutamate synthesis protein (capsule biosynthesis protein)
VGVADHPADFAAGPDRPGIAYADLWRDPTPGWLVRTVQECRSDSDLVLVTPHWGPNMTSGPVAHVRAAARALVEAGASLVAGHSAHVFHGAAGRTLFDLGDFVDDYAVDPVLRNDMGILWLVTVDSGGPTRIEAVPLRLEYCHTRLANRREADWIAARLEERCRPFGTTVEALGDRLLVAPAGGSPV